MKLKWKFCTVLLAAATALSAAGCGGLFGGAFNNPEISLELADGYHESMIAWEGNLEIEKDEIPLKKGYDFLGWYNAETGGAQYINKDGKCMTTFTENMRLYTRYKAHEYSITYSAPAGAQGLPSEPVKVDYDAQLPAFPAVTLEHHTLNGWYTAETGGRQVTNGGSVIEKMKTLSFDGYNLDDVSRALTLYARFDVDQFDVTLKFGGSYADETITVDYGTPLESILYETRNSNGYGVTTWSETGGGTAFTGIIDRDITLYAGDEWAPVIELDYSEGDYGGALIVAQAGAEIDLPTPKKSCSKFMGWKDEYGNPFTQSTMPQDGAKLKASWQGVLEFDSNGGTKVNNISEPANTKIELPKPTRDGYLFAGWFEDNGSKYMETAMPREGKKLKAGWADEKRRTISWEPKSGYYYAGKGEDDAEFLYFKTSDFKNDPFDLTGTWEVTMNISFECLHYSGSSIVFNGWNNLIFGIYSQKTLNSSYELIDPITYPHENVQNYKKYSLTETVTITDGLVYLAFQASTYSNGVRIRNVQVELIYPDLTTLEL